MKRAMHNSCNLVAVGLALALTSFAGLSVVGAAGQEPPERRTLAMIPEPVSVSATTERLFVTAGDFCRPSEGQIVSVDGTGIAKPFAILPPPSRFSTDPSSFGLDCDSPSIAVSRQGEFGLGHLFAARHGTVYKISPDGSKVGEYVELGGTRQFLTGIAFDQVGTFGGAILVIAANMRIYSVCPTAPGSPNGVSKLIGFADGPSGPMGLQVAPMTYQPYGGDLFVVFSHDVFVQGKRRHGIYRLPRPENPGSVCDASHVTPRRAEQVSITNWEDYRDHAAPFKGWHVNDIDFVPPRRCTLEATDGAFFSVDQNLGRVNSFSGGNFAERQDTAVLSGFFSEGMDPVYVSGPSPTPAALPTPVPFPTQTPEPPGFYTWYLNTTPQLRSVPGPGGPTLKLETFHSEENRNPESPNPAVMDADFVPCPTQMSVASSSVREGDEGETSAIFQLTALGTPSAPFSVSYRTEEVPPTASGALLGLDYKKVSGKLTFGPGKTTDTVRVPVIGDVIPESDEIFRLVLSDPDFPDTVTAQGTGRILDDDEISVAFPNLPLPIPGELSAGPQPVAPPATGPPPSGPTLPHSGATMVPNVAQAPPVPPGGATAPVPSFGQAASPGSMNAPAAHSGFEPLVGPVPGAAPPIGLAGQAFPVAMPGVHVPREEERGAAAGLEYPMTTLNGVTGSSAVPLVLGGVAILWICGLLVAWVRLERSAVPPCLALSIGAMEIPLGGMSAQENTPICVLPNLDDHGRM